MQTDIVILMCCTAFMAGCVIGMVVGLVGKRRTKRVRVKKDSYISDFKEPQIHKDAFEELKNNIEEIVKGR